MHGSRTRVGDLAFGEDAFANADGDFVVVGTGTAFPAGDLDAVGGELGESDGGEVREDIGRDVGRRVEDFVKELLAAGAEIEDAAGAGKLGKDGGAVI